MITVRVPKFKMTCPECLSELEFLSTDLQEFTGGCRHGAPLDPYKGIKCPTCGHVEKLDAIKRISSMTYVENPVESVEN